METRLNKKTRAALSVIAIALFVILVFLGDKQKLSINRATG